MNGGFCDFFTVGVPFRLLFAKIRRYFLSSFLECYPYFPLCYRHEQIDVSYAVSYTLMAFFLFGDRLIPR